MGPEWLDRRSTWTVGDVAGPPPASTTRSARSLALAVDLRLLVAPAGATTRDLLTVVRDDIGLGSAMTLLDSGGGQGSHLDDLEALLQVADLHPDAGSFEAWLRGAFRERAEGASRCRRSTG